MIEKLKQNGVIRAAECGVISFLCSFIIVPILFGGTPDVFWIIVLILLPSVLGIVLFWKTKRYLLAYVILSALIQYGLLIVLAGPVSGLWGMSITRTLGWLEYIGATFIFPAIVGAIQWGVLTLGHKIKRK